MKVYNPNASCPKCGQTADRIGTFYLGAYLTRTCQRCRHTWEELPLDSAGSGDTEERFQHKEYGYTVIVDQGEGGKVVQIIPIGEAVKDHPVVSDQVVEKPTDEASIEANAEIPISVTPLPKFIYTPTAMGETTLADTPPPAAKCWCGLELKACGMSDFIEDGPNDTTSIRTLHYECPKHGTNYRRKSYAGIAISGKARAGKSTLADMLVQKLGAPWHVESLSDAVLEEFAKEKWQVEYAEHGLDALLERINANKEAFRPELIELGQRRRTAEPDYWIHRLPCNPNAIIPNCRFSNEYNYFKGKGFYMVRVDTSPEIREARGCPDLDDPSETGLDSVKAWNWDFIVQNDESLKALAYQTDLIAKYVMHGMKPECQCGCDCETEQGDK